MTTTPTPDPGPPPAGCTVRICCALPPGSNGWPFLYPAHRTETPMPLHDHRPPPDLRAGPDPLGRPVDDDLVDQLLGAMIDACSDCQRDGLDRAQDDPLTTARIVELACIAVDQTFGGLPRTLTDATAPGPAHPAFRAMARAGADHGPQALVAEAHHHPEPDRRGALATALDLLAGLL